MQLHKSPKAGGRSQQVDISTGDIKRSILAVVSPMLVAQLLNLLYNIVDRIYIGKIPGEGTLALAGLGLCFPIVTLVTAFANLFGVGGAPLCSIARGQKDTKGAQSIMANAYFMLLLSGVVITIVGIAFHRPILYLFGASADTYQYASDYMTIYLLGTVFVMTSLGLNPYINSQGFAKIGMLTVLLGAAANIVLDPILIYAFGLGVRGAAIATVISQCLSALWVLRFLTGQKRSWCCTSGASGPTGAASAKLPPWVPPALSCPSPTVWCRWCATPPSEASAATSISVS